MPGECGAIIGRNGAGKSALLKLLSRITVPTPGASPCAGAGQASGKWVRKARRCCLSDTTWSPLPCAWQGDVARDAPAICRRDTGVTCAYRDDIMV